jgi:hypothetical protein
LPSSHVFITSQYVQTFLHICPCSIRDTCTRIVLLLVLIDNQPHHFMKNLLTVLPLVAITLSFSSCCSMFGIQGLSAGTRTETKQVQTCHYDTVTEVIPSSSKGGMAQTVEKKVPRYKTVTKKVWVPCPRGYRYYCPNNGCNGTTSEKSLNMVTAQGPTGSPNIGLMPTMKTLAP